MKVKPKQSGVTLAEMLTAVAITVIMLGASGMIFKSASKTSGKAMALNDIMGQVRVATTQIEKDFTGFRGDLPWAVIFEGYNNGDGTFERRDRIFFFANGDFNTLDNIKSDTARIFYGQSQDIYPNPETDGLAGIPEQRILCRAQKLMSSVYSITIDGTIYSLDSSTVGYGYDLVSGLNDWFDHDLFHMEYGPDSNLRNSSSVFFDEWLLEGYNATSSQFYNYNGRSFVRRPIFSNLPVVSDIRVYDKYKQGIYMLEDATDFTVQIWWQPPGETQARWYPNDNDLVLFATNNATNLGFQNSTKNVSYNMNVASGGNVYFGVGSGLKSSNLLPMFINGYEFSTRVDTSTTPPTEYFPAAMNFGVLNILPLDSLEIQRGYERPTAMKISFVIRDNGRVHYPDGRRVEYVVKLPKPKN